MCGRFTREENFQQLAKLLGLQVQPHLEAALETLGCHVKLHQV